MEKEKYLHSVETIVTSKAFGRSNTYANLLRYLVKCTIESNIPKETTVASEIFGKDSFDPSQSTLVRVYIYNLRKKLNRYYESDGVNDILVLNIPKGSYEVQFIEKTAPGKPSRKPLTKILIAIILLSLVAVPFFFHYKVTKSSETLLWRDLLSSKKNTMMVLGDLFIYTEIDSISEEVKIVRDPYINSTEEFNQKKLFHDRNGISLEPMSYAFLIRNSALWVKDLSKVLYSGEKDFVIRTMSRFNPKELSDNDLIVVGMLKTLGIFKDYFVREGYSIDKNSTLTYKDINTGLISNFSTNGDPDSYHTDYALIIKAPGPNNNTIHLFGGLWDTGTSQSLRNFTDLKLVANLETAMKNKFGNIPKYYKILLEVKGIDRMELDSKIIHLEKLDTDS